MKDNRQRCCLQETKGKRQGKHLSLATSGTRLTRSTNSDMGVQDPGIPLQMSDPNRDFCAFLSAELSTPKRLRPQNHRYLSALLIGYVLFANLSRTDRTSLRRPLADPGRGSDLRLKFCHLQQNFPRTCAYAPIFPRAHLPGGSRGTSRELKPFKPIISS